LLKSRLRVASFSASRYCEVPALSEVPAFNGFDDALALSSVNLLFPAL
jgi:hypothetical protein